MSLQWDKKSDAKMYRVMFRNIIKMILRESFLRWKVLFFKVKRLV